MNILIIGADFKPLYGGVAEYTHRLTLHLHKSKDRVIVLSERMKDDASFDASCPYTVHRYDFRFVSSGAVRKYGKGYQWLREFVKTHLPIDIIISNCRDLSSVTALAVAKTLQIPFVIFTYGLEINRKEIKEKLIINLVLHGADTVVCLGTFTQSLVRQFGINPSKITIVPGATDINEYAASTCNETIAVYASKKNARKKIIFTCGKLVERKGHDMVIKALPKILQEVGNVIYIIAGAGPYEASLRKLVHDLKLSSNVILKGRVSNMERKDLYKACDVFVMPCRELKNGDVEGFGLVFLEANVFCKPVVAGRSGGAVDAVEHKKTGLLVNPLDVDEIADAIIYLLTHPEIAVQMGKIGRQRIESQFTWDISGTRLRQGLVRLLTKTL